MLTASAAMTQFVEFQVRSKPTQILPFEQLQFLRIGKYCLVLGAKLAKVVAFRKVHPFLGRKPCLNSQKNILVHMALFSQ